MIVDGHAYCFPPFSGAAGYDSVDDKLLVFQRDLAGHHQPVWRVRDRAPAGPETLMDPETGEPRQVNWRFETNRFTWEYEGDTYTKQYFPPMLHDLEASPELLIREMDYAGVDVALLHTSPYLGRINDYLADAVARYPDRLKRLTSLPEAEIPGGPGAAVARIEEQLARGGAVGYQFLPKYYYESGHSEPWDGGSMRPFWDALVGMSVPVYFTLLSGRPARSYSRADRGAYVEEYRLLRRWTDRYPEATAVITHGMPWRSFLEGTEITFPEAIWDVFDSPRCHMQLLVPIQLGNLWEYPWREAEPALAEAVERVGADRLMWGTDMPMVARFCTYRQALDHIRVHCDFLTDVQRHAILGGTAARLMGLDMAPGGTR